MAKAKPLTSLDPQAPASPMARRAVYTRLDALYSLSLVRLWRCRRTPLCTSLLSQYDAN